MVPHRYSLVTAIKTRNYNHILSYYNGQLYDIGSMFTLIVKNRYLPDMVDSMKSSSCCEAPGK